MRFGGEEPLRPLSAFKNTTQDMLNVFIIEINIGYMCY